MNARCLQATNSAVSGTYQLCSTGETPILCKAYGTMKKAFWWWSLEASDSVAAVCCGFFPKEENHEETE